MKVGKEGETPNFQGHDLSSLHSHGERVDEGI